MGGGLPSRVMLLRALGPGGSFLAAGLLCQVGGSGRPTFLHL